MSKFEELVNRAGNAMQTHMRVRGESANRVLLGRKEWYLLRSTPPREAGSAYYMHDGREYLLGVRILTLDMLSHLEVAFVLED